MSPVVPLFGLMPVTFRRRSLHPPTNLYISKMERLNIRTVHAQTLNFFHFRARILALDGTVIEYEEELHPDPVLLYGEWNVQLPEGFLLSVCISSQETFIQRGEQWVRVELRHGGSEELRPSRVLISGYLSFSDSLSWPEGPLQTPGGGPGRFYTPELGIVPGQNISVQVPEHMRWRIASFKTSFTSDANVANRYLIEQISLAGLLCHRSACPNAQTASLVKDYVWAPGFGTTYLAAGICHMAIPDNLVIPYPWKFEVIALNKQATDYFDSALLLVEEWVLPY